MAYLNKKTLYRLMGLDFSSNQTQTLDGFLSKVKVNSDAALLIQEWKKGGISGNTTIRSLLGNKQNYGILNESLRTINSLFRVENHNSVNNTFNDFVEPKLEGLGGGIEGTQYIFVAANGTPTENAASLQAAYDEAKTMSPSATNRITVIAASGNYNFSSDFVMDEQYIDLVSLDGNRSIIFNGTGTINVETNNVFVKGIDVLDKEFKVASDLNLITIENCKGGDNSFGYEVNVSGRFINCQGGNYSFGGLGDASGYFKDCEGGNFSFGGGGISSGIFEDCKSGNSSFGGGGIANGTYTRCLADFGSFGDEEFLGNMSFCELKSGIYPPINFVSENVEDLSDIPAELPEGLTEEQFLALVFGEENVKYYELFNKDFDAENFGGDPGDPPVNPAEELLNILKILYFADPASILSLGNIITPDASIKASIDGLGLFYSQIGKVASIAPILYNFQLSSDAWNLQLVTQYGLALSQIQQQADPIINQLTQDLENQISDAVPLILQAISQLEQDYSPSSTLPSGYTEEQLIQEAGLSDVWDFIGLANDAYNELYEENEDLQKDIIELLSGVIIQDGNLNNVQTLLNQLESDLENHINGTLPLILQTISQLTSLIQGS